MAAGAVSGILGTFLYPVIRKQIGLERTGLFGFFFEVSFLCLCVASVWAPGSPFNLLYWKDENRSLEGATWNMECNASLPHSNITMDTLLNSTEGMISYNVTDVGDANATLLAAGSMGNMTDAEKSNIVTKELKKGHSYVSIWLLLAGIIGARCGEL
jgi:iron-regulated transporter 1